MLSLATGTVCGVLHRASERLRWYAIATVIFRKERLLVKRLRHRDAFHSLLASSPVALVVLVLVTLRGGWEPWVFIMQFVSHFANSISPSILQCFHSRYKCRDGGLVSTSTRLVEIKGTTSEQDGRDGANCKLGVTSSH